MYLSRIHLANFGLVLEPRTYEFGRLTSLIGENGSGKTTLIDAAQTVFTGALQKITSYNVTVKKQSGAKKGVIQRNLQGFVLGGDDQNFARDTANGWVCGVFELDAEERAKFPGFPAVFSAAVGCSAYVEETVSGRREARMEGDVAHLIVVGAALTLEDFAQVAGGEVEVRPPRETIRSIKRKYEGRPGVQIRPESGPNDYLCRLYGLLTGEQGELDRNVAVRAARVVAMSLAPQGEVANVAELIREQVLPVPDIPRTIGNLRALLSKMGALHAQAEQLASLRGALKSMEGTAQDWAQNHRERWRLQALKYGLALKGFERDLAFARRDHAAHASEFERIKREEVAFAADAKRANDRYMQLQLQAANLDCVSQEKRLLEERAGYEKEHRAAAADIGSACQMLVQLAESVKKLSELARPPSLLKAAWEAALGRIGSAKGEGLTVPRCALLKTRVAGDLAFDALTSVAVDFVNVSQAATRLSDAFRQGEVALNASEARGDLRRKRDDLNARHEQLRREIDLLQQGRSLVPEHVSEAVLVLRRELPASNPQPLCDLVEHRSQDWSRAIESLVGNARFTLLVEPGYEVKALSILKREAAHNRRIEHRSATASIADFKSDEGAAAAIIPDSIGEEIKFNSERARQFFALRFGNVVKCDDEQALSRSRRGLMRDGSRKGSFELSGRRVDQEETTFGRQGREAQRARRLEEQSRVAEQIEAIDLEYAWLYEVARCAQAIEAAPEDASQRLCAQWALTAQNIRGVQDRLELLDMSEAADIRQLIAEERDADHAARRRFEVAMQASSNAQAEVTSASNVVDRLERELPARQAEAQCSIQAYVHACAVDAELDSVAMERSLLAEIKSSGRSIDQIDRDFDLAGKSTGGYQTSLNQKCEEYNRLCQSADMMIPTVAVVRDEAVEAKERDRSAELSQTLPEIARALARGTDGYIRVVCFVRDGRQRDNEYSRSHLVRNQEEIAGTAKSFREEFTREFCEKTLGEIRGGVDTLRDLNRTLRGMVFSEDCFELSWEFDPAIDTKRQFLETVKKLATASETFNLLAPDNGLDAEQCRIRDKLLGDLMHDDAEYARTQLEQLADYRLYYTYVLLKFKPGEGPDPAALRRSSLSKQATSSGGQNETPSYVIRSALLASAFKHSRRNGPTLRLMINDEVFANMDPTRGRAVLQYLALTLRMQLIVAGPPGSKLDALFDMFDTEFQFMRVPVVGVGDLTHRSTVNVQRIHGAAVGQALREWREAERARIGSQFDAEVRPTLGALGAREVTEVIFPVEAVPGDAPLSAGEAIRRDLDEQERHERERRTEGRTVPRRSRRDDPGPGLFEREVEH